MMKGIEKELNRIMREENRMRARARKSREPAWKRKLEEKVPPKVLEGLQKAFSKAFFLIFEKGVGVIEGPTTKRPWKMSFVSGSMPLN